MSTIQQFMIFINAATKLQRVDNAENIRKFKQFVAKADRIIESAWSERKSRFEEFVVRAKKLSKKLRKFNILDTLGVTRREHSHTHVISWLLNPMGTHGFRDAFLRAFMERLGLAELDVKGADVRPFQRSQDGFEVDITVENPAIFMIIENKITHKAGKPQLSREFSQFNPKDGREFIPVYLTPFNEEIAPHKEFKLVRYTDVAEMIEELLQACRHEDEKIFLKHYITKLRELTMSEFKAFSEKSKLYLKYYEVIQDFVQAFDKDKERLFDAIIKGIEEQDWYSPEWNHQSTATVIKIFKRNWKNEERGMGAHYEFWLGKYDIQKGKMPLTFHIEDDVGDRDLFAKELHSMAEEELNKLKGYQVKGGAPTFLTTSIDFNEESIVKDAVEKISEITFLEKYVDKTFEKMKGHHKNQ
ncbi:MAG: PD-(D/E)XK nuclease family protein [Candidatus Bathyarchaeota archaeon]|nr:PD-(D/E)XK nuclease family protein [Candidatus Bathyarchaeota archaeon]